VFTKILLAVFGVDETTDLKSKITSVLTPSAEHLVNIFISEVENELPIDPIIGAISEGLDTSETSLHLRSLNSWIEHVVSVINFAEICVRVRGYLKYTLFVVEGLVK
jgi:nuclear pore complex protein Nup188